MDENKITRQFAIEQKKLQNAVIIQDLKKTPKIVAAADCTILDAAILSAVVTFTYPELIVLEVTHELAHINMPLIPGFAGFREIPTLTKAYSRLKQKPDLVFIDGPGIAHPRRFGIASHFGLFAKVPTIGVSKKPLVGKYNEPDKKAGSYTELVDKGQLIGFAFRSLEGSPPLFISPGHHVSFKDTLFYVKKTIGKFRLPEPARIADKYSKSLQRAMDQEMDHIFGSK